MAPEPRKIRPFPRIPKPKRAAITRAEFDRVIAILNERGRILDDIRHNLDLQFTRIAQIQAELDRMAAREATPRRKRR